MNQFSRCLSNVRTALNIIVHEEQREKKKTHLSPPLSGQVIDFSAHYAFTNHLGQNHVDNRGFNIVDKSLEFLINNSQYMLRKGGSSSSQWGHFTFFSDLCICPCSD